MGDFSLNALGILCGTDKSQLGFDYLRHYDRALAKFRDLPMNLVEIGVADGPSARMWERYFPRAHVVGVDIQEKCRQFATDRVTIAIGSQTDGAFIDDLMANHPPTVMIDDGSHIASDIIFTFERAFPAVLPGGCYVIEDLVMHKDSDANRQRGTAPMGAQDYILTYSRYLMDRQMHPLYTSPAHHKIAHSIDHIDIVNSAAFIWKKEATEIDFGWLEILAQQRASAGGPGAPAIWSLLAGYILRNGGPLPVAERAIRSAIEGAPGRWTHESTLGDILARIGNHSEAATWLRKASETAPEPWRTDIMARLGKSER